MHIPCSWILNVNNMPQRNYGIIIDVHDSLTVVDLTSGGAITSIERDQRCDLRAETYATLTGKFNSGDTQTILQQLTIFANTGGNLATPTP